MIDVGKKEKTERIARAGAFVELSPEIIEKIKSNAIPKGNVLEIARVAGIMAVKKTDEIIPLCHNIEIEYADVSFMVKQEGVEIESIVKTTAKTGVEMEAMAACSTAALTIYDMCKMFSKSIKITNIELLEKRGGKSGVYKKR
ncbi:MAG: cyclic pyranopterin monophosphate synthase MoaC [Candidatus Omnitrophota bacterium]